MNVNEEKTKWVGFLTWILVGISSVLWEAEFRSPMAPRAVMLFGAFLIFGIAFLIGTRPGCTNAVRIPILIIETLAAYWCVTLEPTGFQPVLLVIIAAQLGAFPPRFAVIAIAVNSFVLAFIMADNGGSPVIYALGPLTTGVSLLVIATALTTVLLLRARRIRRGSDAGRGTV